MIMNIIAAAIYLIGIIDIWNKLDTHGGFIYIYLLPFAILGFLCNLIPIYYVTQGSWTTYMLVSNILALVLNLIIALYNIL